MTQPNTEPQVVSLQDLIAQGGETGMLAFHLMSLNYHASVIEMEGGEQALQMLLDMLGQHASVIYTLLEKSEDIEVVKPTLIVPGR